MSTKSLDDLVRERAHALWLARDCQPGCPESDWRQAEQEVMAELKKKTPAVAKPVVAVKPVATPAKEPAVKEVEKPIIVAKPVVAKPVAAVAKPVAAKPLPPAVKPVVKVASSVKSVAKKASPAKKKAAKKK